MTNTNKNSAPNILRSCIENPTISRVVSTIGENIVFMVNTDLSKEERTEYRMVGLPKKDNMQVLIPMQLAITTEYEEVEYWTGLKNCSKSNST